MLLEDGGLHFGTPAISAKGKAMRKEKAIVPVGPLHLLRNVGTTC
jgi:hypothetical protein